jgi:DNA-directed RNA polymerase subunit L
MSRPHTLGNAIRWCNVSDNSLANVMNQSHANAFVLVEAVILSERKRCHFCLYRMKHHTLGKSIQIIAMRHM